MRLPNTSPAQGDNTAIILIKDIRRLISEAKSGIASTINSALTMLYWQIGRRIHVEVLSGERAEYGEQIVATLAKKLEVEHGRGFSAKNLRHMLRFAEAFPSQEFVYALSRQLSWTHFRYLIYIEDSLKRCRHE